MVQNRGVVVGIEGIIGSGKTNFSKALTHHLGAETMLYLEPDEKEGKNPYLASYYEDPGRWSFTMQIHLLTQRYRIHQHAQWFSLQTGNVAVLDRTLPGDTAFARLQKRRLLMSEDEFNSYGGLYHAMVSNSLLPNICIHLHVSPHKAKQRIQNRMQIEKGRKCEDSIPIDYLIQLNEEISVMTQVLEEQGVLVIDIDWNKDCESIETHPKIIETARWIKEEFQVASPFLEKHRRII